MDAATFLGTLASLMGDNPPADDDAPAVEQLAAIGVVPGEEVDLGRLDDETAVAVAEGMEEAKKQLSRPPSVELENGWLVIRTGIGSYGSDYARRAFVAGIGLGANLPEDAIYPLTKVDDEGRQLNGGYQYVLHFDKGEAPPANAFWSLTMYDMRQFFVDNPLDRYAIGDRDPLSYNDDGSLELRIQHEEPASGKSNWLPAPEGDFNLILRIYWPNAQMLDGTWTVPGVHRTG
jgi:hypothetical protein